MVSLPVSVSDATYTHRSIFFLLSIPCNLAIKDFFFHVLRENIFNHFISTTTLTTSMWILLTIHCEKKSVSWVPHGRMNMKISTDTSGRTSGSLRVVRSPGKDRWPSRSWTFPGQMLHEIKFHNFIFYSGQIRFRSTTVLLAQKTQLCGMMFTIIYLKKVSRKDTVSVN